MSVPISPDERIWKKINQAILDENLGTVIVTMLSGLYQAIIHAGVCADEEQARVHLAASILSPDSGPVGSLVPRLQTELEFIKTNKRPLEITTKYTVEPLKNKPEHGQLCVQIFLNGKGHTEVIMMSGPIEDIRQFAAGEIDNDEVMRRWKMKG